MGSVLLVQLLALLKQASPPGPAALLWLTQGKQTQLLGDWDRVRLIPSCTCTRAGLPTCISVFGLHVKGRSQYYPPPPLPLTGRGEAAPGPPPPPPLLPPRPRWAPPCWGGTLYPPVSVVSQRRAGESQGTIERRGLERPPALPLPPPPPSRRAPLPWRRKMAAAGERWAGGAATGSTGGSRAPPGRHRESLGGGMEPLGDQRAASRGVVPSPGGPLAEKGPAPRPRPLPHPRLPARPSPWGEAGSGAGARRGLLSAAGERCE